MRAQRDGLHASTRAAGRDGVRELVEGYHEHLEGPEDVAHVGDVPEEGDDHHIGDDDAEGYFLRVVDCEGAAEEVVVLEGGVGGGVEGESGRWCVGRHGW